MEKPLSAYFFNCVGTVRGEKVLTWPFENEKIHHPMVYKDKLPTYYLLKGEWKNLTISTEPIK
jgi:hypothetical protein